MATTQPADLPYLGSPVYIAGTTYFVPSLSVAQFIDAYDALTQPPAAEDKEGIKARFDLYIPIIQQAMARNYPDITAEKLRDSLDLRTFQLCLKAVQNTSGLVEGKPGE